MIVSFFIKKEFSGKGSAIKISLFESLSEWMNVPFLQYFYTKSAPKRVGLSHPSIVPYGAFLTKDNKNILFSIQNEREWRAFSKEIINFNEIYFKSVFIKCLLSISVLIFTDWFFTRRNTVKVLKNDYIFLSILAVLLFFISLFYADNSKAFIYFQF